MRNLKRYFTLTVSVLLLLGTSMPVLAQGAQAENLIGWWLFDSPKDEMGNWADITLHGSKLTGGQLVVESGKWAHALEYSGPEIEEKTLMSWVALDDLAATKGSTLTLDKVSIDQFNGIVYAEREANRWMSGSSWFRRTQDFADGVDEKKKGELVFLAFTYADDGGNTKVTGYRNGEKIGSYTQGPLKTWPTDDAEAIWGKRHTGDGINGPGDLNAHIEESRIYGVALTEAEVKDMEIGTLSVEVRDKLTTQWAKIKTQ